MKTIKYFLIIVILIASNQLIAQTTRYVDPSGTYGNLTPCYSTIQAAVTASVAGDIIQVNTGTYTGNISLNKNNLTLMSINGAASTIINGNNSGSFTGTVFLPSGSTGTRIGSIGHGFTIIGLDGGPALEKSAIYLQGTQTNITIEDNILQAAGCEALMGEYNANNNNIVINKNKITGQTFSGTPVSGSSNANSAMQAVVFGGGTGTTNTKNFTFTNNQISTVTGSGLIGNCLVTLDLVGSNVISGNTFDGTIGSSFSAYALRLRGSGTYTVQNNVFNGTFNYALFSQNSLVATTNYWGSSKGPNVGSNACPGTKYISSNVSYEPWYNDAALTSLVYKLAAYSVSGSTAICSGSVANVSLSNTQNGNNYQYQLYIGGSTAVGSPVSGNGSSISIPVNIAGTYTMKATNTLNSCVLNMSSNAVMTIKSRPTANITGGTNSTVTLAVTGTGPWNGTLSNGTAFSGASSPITVNVVPVGTTTYTVSSLSDASCTAFTGDLSGSHTIVSNVATPEFSPVAGTYYNPKLITINCSTIGAQIKYTLDGSTPSASNGTLFSVPFVIGTNTTVKAIGLKSGMTNSEISEAYYNILIDTDFDGVVDSDDEYPEDSSRAFNNFFPLSGFATLVFEDSWPSKGDYDMNDVVIDYQFKNILNKENKLVQTIATFVLKASGASFNNGFGFQLPNNNIINSDISVTGNIMNANYITLDNNGTESNQNKPTIIVFDNAFGVLHHPGGTGINTVMGSIYVNPVKINVVINYPAYKYNEQQLDISHFNPFIIINKVRGREVHLPDNAPTSLATPSLFGTQVDNSNALLNRYYKTATNLPWALNIYESFSYPIEKTPINEAYTHFIDWVVGNGEVYQTWYKDLDGNRNSSKLYFHQNNNLKKTNE